MFELLAGRQRHAAQEGASRSRHAGLPPIQEVHPAAAGRAARAPRQKAPVDRRRAPTQVSTSADTSDDDFRNWRRSGARPGLRSLSERHYPPVVLRPSPLVKHRPGSLGAQPIADTNRSKPRRCTSTPTSPSKNARSTAPSHLTANPAATARQTHSSGSWMDCEEAAVDQDLKDCRRCPSSIKATSGRRVRGPYFRRIGTARRRRQGRGPRSAPADRQRTSCSMTCRLSQTGRPYVRGG